MNLDNPLIIYRKWFLTLRSDIADLLSIEILQSLSQFIENDICLYTKTSRKEQPSIYELHSTELVELIDHLIISNEKFTNQRTAVIILSTSAIFMQNIDTEFQHRREKILEGLFESIRIRKQEATKYWEKTLNELEEERRYQTKIDNSWERLLENDFSYPSIHAYLVSEFYQRHE